ncbi:aspartate aminotransferase, aminotransferase, classes I and II [Campylobacter pinnipediorum subsp. pinnipediorum]|uniref:pyridoxal phosphate-dependent aminotransferase n=1 Tax=Campylobacter pinnipediorum TaxID=1965231 RepID=UPI000994FF9E|nr:pyridoxal phosphate-dependent aminotransferase [Campylobacter pinnipediorum]AQW84331.1 aspartate aminotransferase, aminotransferase, classes I and II [Campylobacter pinnipediorum subsp. pinnipediorum]
MLSQRMQTLSESLTIAISAKAKQMKADGVDVISFSAGEPDFDTPKAIKDAVKEALDSGCGKYTAVAGEPDVLKAIATKLKKDNNLTYATNQIVTNVGAKHSLFNIFQALIDKGDEVIIPSPYWVSYPEIVKFSGGVPVFLETNDECDFKITPKQLKDAITEKTKVFCLNHPNNPTGSVYTKDELLEFAEILKGTNIIVLSDEIYEKLTYDTEFVAVASISEDMFKRTVTINGLSKCGAMPGWRFGYMASVMDELNAAVKKLQSQSTSNISTLTQRGAIASLLGKSDDDIKYMKNEFQKRRDLAVELINNIDGLKVKKPNGAFYLFVNCKEVDEDSVRFCKKMLEEAKVATVPGIGFGMQGYFRLSFATDTDSIKKGIERISNFVKNYKI